MQRDQLESHIECAAKRHLDLACGELRDTQEKLKEKTKHFDGLEERANILHEQLEEKINDIQHQHQNNVDLIQQQHQQRVNILQTQLERKVKSCQTKLQERVNILHEQLEVKINDIQRQHQNNIDLIQQQHQRRVVFLQTQFQQKVKTCETKLEQEISKERKMVLVCLVLGLVFLTHYLTKIEDRVHKYLEEKLSVIQSQPETNEILQMDPKKFHIFIWKVTSFKNKVKNNRDVESVQFYAYGYKLMLRLYPIRFDNGQNTHLSIAIFVMKGEYDAILPWGFSKKVTITLIDQQDNPDQRQDVAMGFTADPNNIAFKKPAQGEGRSGYGFPQFVSHSDLKTRRFIVDDTLFIKVQVH